MAENNLLFYGKMNGEYFAGSVLSNFNVLTAINLRLIRVTIKEK